MNAAELMQTCPDPETLSAFLDQKLDPKARMAVVTHLVDCGDCRDIVVAANEYAQISGGIAGDGAAEGGEVVRGRFGPRWRAPMAAAAAAIVVALAGTPWFLQMQRMKELVDAANASSTRSTAARLSGDFAYRAHPVFRGGGDDVNDDTADNSQFLAEATIADRAARASERAEKNPTPANLHAAGIGELLKKGNGRDLNQAVSELAAAAKAKPRSAAIQIDLAAAYLERGAKGDDGRALEAAETALRIDPKSPAAHWNRALALERSPRSKDAINAWHAYLTLDPSSPWAQEVRENHLSLLTEP